MAVYVTGAVERISRNNKQFGIMTLEDYTGKFEFALWSEDYLRFATHFKQGICLYVNGAFKPNRFNENEYEFKVQSMQLLQEVKRTHTRKLFLITQAQFITAEIVDFLVDNAAKYPGKCEISMQLIDQQEELQVKLHTFNRHIEMNDELAHFLDTQPDIDVYIDTINK